LPDEVFGEADKVISMAPSVQNAAAHAANYAIAAADNPVSCDWRFMNDDGTVRAGAAGAIDTLRTDDGLGIIGAFYHRENKGADGKGGDYRHSHGRRSPAVEPFCGTAAIGQTLAKKRPTHDIRPM
jgi:hypothetical protein